MKIIIAISGWVKIQFEQKGLLLTMPILLFDTVGDEPSIWRLCYLAFLICVALQQTISISLLCWTTSSIWHFGCAASQNLFYCTFNVCCFAALLLFFVVIFVLYIVHSPHTRCVHPVYVRCMPEPLLFGIFGLLHCNELFLFGSCVELPLEFFCINLCCVYCT